MSGPTTRAADVMPGAEPFAFPGTRRRRPNRRPAGARLHRHADEHAAVGRAPRRGRVHRALPAPARPRHPLAGRQRQHPRRSGRRRSARRSTRSPPSATASSWPGCRWAAPWRSGWPRSGPDDLAGLMLVNPALLTQRLDAKLLPLLARITPQLGADRQRHQEARRHRAGLSQAADPGDDAAPPAVGGHPRRPGQGHHAGASSSTAPRTTSSSRSTPRCCSTASPARTPPRSSCGTATTWPPSTTTPRRSSVARWTGSRAAAGVADRRAQP